MIFGTYGERQVSSARAAVAAASSSAAPSKPYWRLFRMGPSCSLGKPESRIWRVLPGSHELRQLVEPGEHRVPLGGGEPEDHPLHAGALPRSDGGAIGRRPKDRDRDRTRIAPGELRTLSYIGDALFDVLVVQTRDRDPAVAVVDGPLVRLGPVSAEENRRVRLLRRLRLGPDGVEAHQLAVILRRRLGPDLLHGLDPLADEPPARLRVGAVVLHLLVVPAAAD